MADDGQLPRGPRPPATRSMREHRVAALERRIAGHDGDLRKRLDARLQALIDGAAAAAPRADSASLTARDAAPQPGPLGALAADIAARSRSTTYPELEALGQFRALWSKLGAEHRFRESMQQDTEDAGPLNSGRLAHRMLQTAHGLSPGYVQHLLDYIDTLSWMAQFDGAGGEHHAAWPAATSAVKPRAKSRSRKRGT